MPMNSRSKEEILKEFDAFMQVPEAVSQMQGQSCFVCGQPYNKGPQVEKIRDLMKEYAKAYALHVILEGRPLRESLAYRSDWPGVVNEIMSVRSEGYNRAIDDYENRMREIIGKE